MASPRQLILDTWAGLSFKRGLGPLSATGGGRSWAAPTWVGEQNERRLAAYKVLDGIFRNVGREFLNTDDDQVKADHREYGDAALLVKVVLAAVLGDDIGITVEGADDNENTAAGARQAWFDDWATTERFRAKVMETERDTQKLGDGVYVLGVNRDKGRVRLRLYDPGFYFPEIDPNAAEDEFPRRVHIAWQYEEKDPADPTKVADKVRRITWELADRPEGPRRLPWNDKPTATTCYMTDATWALGDIEGYDVEHFPMGRATPALTETPEGPRAIDRLDLDLDFLPVIHEPNTVAIKDHFGEALLTAVAQILEDLARADTDAAKAAALAGVPMLGAAGIAAGDVKVKPGTVLGLGPTGSLTVVDLSASLRAIMEYVSGLRDRLNENVRVPAEVVGRVKANTERSGIELALSFGPMRSLIEEQRLVRNEKYPLLLKFIQRMSIAAGFLDGPVMDATVKFGSFLPTDRSAAIALVTELWGARLISRQTAIQMLVDEGILDVDVAEEVARAEADDFVAALDLLGATEGDFDAVYDFLHRTRPQPQPAEPVIGAGINPTTGNPRPPLPPRPPRAGGPLPQNSLPGSGGQLPPA